MIIGITGTLGAGKGSIMEYLEKKYSFLHYSARDFIAIEIEKRGLPVNRDTLTEVGNDLRATHHPGYVIEQLYNQARVAGGNAVIESIRTVGEIDAIFNKESFYLFAIDADPKLRYERIKNRKSATDDVSFERFLADEEREMQSDSPHKQNLRACIARADYVFINNDSLEVLHTKVDEVVNKLLVV